MKLDHKFFKQKRIIIGLLGVFLSGLVLLAVNYKEEDLVNLASFKVLPTDRYELYSTSSPYTVIEYLDLNCVYCKSFHEEKEKHKAQLGNINLVVRNYPLLDSGRSAYKVLIGECVASQSGTKAWFQYIDLSYKGFDKRYDNNYFFNLGSRLVSDKIAFSTCLNDKNLMDKVAKSRVDNLIDQVTYVPTLVVLKNGVLVKKYDGVTTRGGLEVLKYYTYLSDKEIK